ncbi:WD40 repeat-like protein [Violaceomyces palustris]|uniref:WD40 repeat-like protein n=1 Tax=Violaceomyces palustris TaxID=1673888 RepID=A0ACD0NT98_9BASI|nr:WD40 repeat-like protein [Violaceomyces palustris]
MSVPSQSIKSGVPASNVPVLLTTSLSSYAIPAGPYMLPTDWRRTHLSTLVNKLINTSSTSQDDTSSSSSTTNASIPFDFIVDGQLLRTSLQDYIQSNGLTNESTLNIEYIRSTLPPTYVAAFEHDDWVASVDASKQGLFLTSSYDGSVRIFSSSDSKSAIHTFSSLKSSSANASLVDARWVPSRVVDLEQDQRASHSIVTAGMDGVVRMWKATLPESSQASSSFKPTAKRLWNGEFHSHPVSSLDVSNSPNSERSYLISSGWEGALAFWDATRSNQQGDGEEDDDGDEDDDQDDDEDDDDDGSDQEGGDRRRKRRKVKNGKRKKGSNPSKVKKPVLTMWHSSPPSSLLPSSTVPGANARVSRAIFEKIQGSSQDSKTPSQHHSGADRAWSAGWDGGVKGWDLESGGSNFASKTSDKVILCLDQMAPLSASSAPILVTGHMDRSVAIWDMRTDVSTIANHLTNVHKGPVSCIRSHPTSGYIFSTSSYDGSVKLWDTRSTKQSLFSLVGRGATKGEEEGEKEKVLCLDWSSDGQIIVSGGEDKAITVHRGSGIGRSD